MNIDEKPFARELNCWASLHMPARVNVAQTAKLLGFAEHDIPILTSARLLNPLGKPSPSSPKWFCTCEMIALVADRDWLSKATQTLSRHWLTKRQRRSVFKTSEAKDASSEPHEE